MGSTEQSLAMTTALVFIALISLTQASPFDPLLRDLGVHGDCNDVYQQDTDNCGDGCGRCFNPNGRSATDDVEVVMCPDAPSSYGYYCNSDGGVFACMDWTFGSQALSRQETAFKSRTGEDVWFGVGTFGTGDDPMQGLGNCYRLVVKETVCSDRMAGRDLEKNVIAQSVNTGHDVANIQFDLQMGNGGTGAFNNCAGNGWSMFPGPFDEAVWGAQYGGCSYRDSSQGSPSCDDLPPYPQEPNPMTSAGDNLVDMCKWSFDQGVRGASGTGGENPTIIDMARVECPQELVEMTQLKRSDDPPTFKIEEANRPPPYQSANAGSLEPCHCTCGANDCKYCLTRMMDCRKPSSGFIDNMKPELLEDGFKVVQPCTNDGYTRVDVKCGCMDCYC